MWHPYQSLTQLIEAQLWPLLTAGGLLIFCGGLIVYHHFGYPLLIRFLARRQPNPHYPVAPELYPRSPDDALAPEHWPPISLIIPVYNESAHIAEKIRNLALLDYPSDCLEIRFIFDGCTDDSVDIAEKTLQEPLCQHLPCILQIEEQNQGKLQQLNRAIPKARFEIIALSDLSALMAVDALKLAALWFKRKHIGAVCATYRFLSNAGTQEQSYWHYQCSIKQAESQIGSTLGAHGAFYLLRQSLFQPLPLDSINDDFILPCRIVEQGYRVVYDPRIIAIELESSALEQDFQRRLRISAGNMQQSLRLTGLLHPKLGHTSWMFFSCKWLRPFMPWCFIGCFVASIWLSLISYWLSPILLLQLLVYGLVIKQQLQPGTQPALVKLHYLISGHVLGLIGGIDYLRGRYQQPWKKVSH